MFCESGPRAFIILLRLKKYFVEKNSSPRIFSGRRRRGGQRRQKNAKKAKKRIPAWSIKGLLNATTTRTTSRNSSKRIIVFAVNNHGTQWIHTRHARPPFSSRRAHAWKLPYYVCAEGKQVLSTYSRTRCLLSSRMMPTFSVSWVARVFISY